MEKVGHDGTTAKCFVESNDWPVYLVACLFGCHCLVSLGGEGGRAGCGMMITERTKTNTEQKMGVSR